jgi:hypothetical protein
MGLYINNIGDTYQEKINTLIAVHSGEITDNTYKPNLIIVVDNGYFGAALYVKDQKEYNRVMMDDARPKTWLVVPNAKELAR